MLDVPRLLVIVQILGHLLIREMTSEPRIPPEKKRHEHDQPSGGKEKNFLSARHAALGTPGDSGSIISAGDGSFWLNRHEYPATNYSRVDYSTSASSTRSCSK